LPSLPLVPDLLQSYLEFRGAKLLKDLKRAYGPEQVLHYPLYGGPPP
jgi:hypothetical protein